MSKFNVNPLYFDLVDEEVLVTIDRKEEKKMELKDIKKANLKEAKKQYDEERKNAEIEYAKNALKSAQDEVDYLDREIKTLEERRQVHLDVIAQFKGN